MPEEMPWRTEDEILSECLMIIKKLWPAENIREVEIERLKPTGTAPNWRLARLYPEPPPIVNRQIREYIAQLTQTYALK